MVAQLDKVYLRTRFWKLWSRLIAYGLFEGRPVTTSMRWLNSLVFTLSAFIIKFPVWRKVKKPVFIVGIGRSGTTVLGKIMSMHHQVGYLNEPKAMWHAITPNEDLVGSYSRLEASYRLGAKDVNSQNLKYAHRMYGAYLALSFSGRVVDKYPELIFRIPFVKALFPDAKFLFLVRNGWDTCCSIDHWSERLGTKKNNETHDWWGVDKRKWHLMVDQLVSEQADLSPHIQEMHDWNKHSDMAAVEWILTMREGLRLVELYPTDILRVNYESLCLDPASELRQITDFTQLSNQDQCFFDYGVQTLKLVQAKDNVTLHPIIASAFMSTMSALGY